MYEMWNFPKEHLAEKKKWSETEKEDGITNRISIRKGYDMHKPYILRPMKSLTLEVIRRDSRSGDQKFRRYHWRVKMVKSTLRQR